MNVSLLDMQETSGHWNGVTIEDEKILLAALDELRKREPFLLEIKGTSGFKLLVGIGGSLGCVQFSPSNGDPPYLMAVATGPNRVVDHRSEIEFLAGGTPSPIPIHQCLAFDLVKEIVIFFSRTGGRSPNFAWEEV